MRDKTDVSESTDTNKTDGLRECIICHYQYFLGLNCRFQPKVCDDCYEMAQKPMNFNNFDIVSVGRNDYRIHFWFMTKSEAENKMKKVDLSEKSGQLFEK